MQVSDDIKLDFDDILLVPQRSSNASRKDVDLKRTYQFFHSPKSWNGCPIMAANMDTTGTFAMGLSLMRSNAITCLHKHYSYDEIYDFFKHHNTESNIWVSIGMGGANDLNKLIRIKHSLGYSPNICIDIANGYTEKFVGWCATVREEHPEAIIMAGNVCTPEMVQELILHGGVDIVKIGIGPGSACTTRLKTGCGYPQLSAIMECSQAAHGLKSDEKRMGLICADGGCRKPADVAKAFAAGADFVMLGGMLAGTDECEGEWEYATKTTMRFGYLSDVTVEKFVVDGLWESSNHLNASDYKDGEKVKHRLKFYGMSSKDAQEKYNNGLADYKASEGRVMYVDYKGKAEDIMKDILGGIRSCCAYIGATCLKDLPKCAKAVRVNRVHFDTKT